MVGLVWDNETERKYTTGVSKGVFFDGSGKGHAWSGLISVTEKPQTNEPTAIYNSLGQKYDQYGNVAEKKHGLSCYTYPEAMDEFLGYEYLEDVGFSVDERPPKKFHMAYRVELGNGLYEIHVLLNQIATFGETNRSTWSNNTSLSTITMNLTGAADPRYGTSHIVLDSRLPITESAEPILFGDPFNDSNINDFLEAEPTWETVAVNYAPIIEPDYDNYVWLGGRNLFLATNSNMSYYASTNNSAAHSFIRSRDSIGYYIESYAYESTNPVNLSAYAWKEFDDSTTYSSSGDYSNPTETLMHSIDLMFDKDSYLRTDEYNYPLNYIMKAGEWYTLYRFTSEKRPRLPNFSTVDGDSTTPLRMYYRNVKLEKIHPSNPVPTPWTPAPELNYVPPSDQPRPANYVPGVKGVSGNADIIPFYDEIHNRLGTYSLLLRKHYNSITWVHALPGDTPLRYTARVSKDRVASDEQYNSLIGLSSPLRVKSIPPTPGEYDLELIHTLTGSESSRYQRVDNNDLIGSIIYFDKLMTTYASYSGPYFDIFTKPKSKGDRYVRVRSSRNTFDYTLKQELRLRSKSRVRIYDQTSYDYWLEADDSQLIRQNETFTFSGPQAEITGDTFTINDEILGSEGF